jgi:hypothetical protein
MANGYIPSGTLAILVGDGGLTQATPSPTQVNSDNVNACIETQSTTRSDIFMKPKTNTEISAIANPTSGMWAFSSDSDNPVFYDGVIWNQINPTSGFRYAAGNLTTANIQNMSAVPVGILPAPGAGLTHIIHSARIVVTYAGALFTGGGVIAFQYGNTALGAGATAVNGFPAAFLTATASNKSITFKYTWCICCWWNLNSHL